jgi:outer membrane biosynthesis protein TonB
MTISVVGHSAVLLWALVSFAWPTDLKPTPEQAMPVDLITADQFTKLTAGTQKAPKREAPKPVAEKIGEAKPVDDPNAKVAEKKPVVATTDKSAPVPEPKPEPKPAAAPPKPKVEAKAKAEEKKEPEKKVDPIAEAIKKDAAKQAEKKPEPKSKPQPVKKAERQQPKFDPRKIAALLDKRDAHRQAATGASLNSIASLGAPTTGVERLSQTALDALRARLMALWNPPAASRNVVELIVRVHVRLARDGTLAAQPQVLNSGDSPLFKAASDSALRAIYRGQPFDMLPPWQYDIWKEMDITFDPRDLAYGG